MKNCLKENLSDKNCIFVFSTDVVMNSWIDWCVCNEEESGVAAVPLERFISWDKFKGSYAGAQEENKSPVPSLLRKIFVRNLIQKNAQEPFFKKIINPQYAATAASFTDWICRMLPSLLLWHKRFEEASSTPEYTADDEDNDYELLFEHYKSFLDANNFFEPAWVTPDFSGSGKKIFIFYPEILEDFADYKEVFDKCPEIHLIMLPKEGPEAPKPKCIKYSDSRKELRMTILAIRKLVAEGKANWTDITLNVPDLETYRPYLERELSTYCVPYVIRAGFPLTSNCAGIVFKEILDCYNSDFSYESVRRLLQDNYIPWKTNDKEVRENLIREGQRLRCICGYDKPGGEHVDIWKEALSKINHDEREFTFYNQLKKEITAICKSNTFAAIHTAWMAFKEHYLEPASFSETADKIISRCITLLNELIQIEEKFCIPLGLTIDQPYNFFINELSGKTYTPQNPATGISVFPYKLSAAGAFKYQFVIDSSQKNLELPFKRLSFLNARKRSFFKLTDEDKIFNASKAFIRLYAGAGVAAAPLPMFSSAEDTFDGFAIAHTYLKTDDEKVYASALAELENEDFIQNEKRWFLQQGPSTSSGTAHTAAFSETQKNQFQQWDSFNQNRNNEHAPYKVPPVLQKKINEFLIQNRNKHLPPEKQAEAKITLSQSDMGKFFPCPRKWIFSTVLNLKSDSLSTSLSGRFDMGNIHHKILELYGKHLMEQKLTLPKVADGVLEEEEQLKKLIEGFALKAINNPEESFYNSPLTKQMLESQIPAITKTIITFLREFCNKFNGYKIYGVEKWYGGNNANRSWNYTGKIDCILVAGAEHPEDTGWTIIDYKNTSSAMPTPAETKVSDDGILGDFQVPMYITLIRENETVKEISLAAFYAINFSSSGAKNNIVVDETNKNKKLQEYETTIKSFEEYAQKFAECVQNENYSLGSVDTFEDCGGCEYKSICRFNYTIAGREK
ncbi:MAG: PD-(D/E)XK nuclease family protein [Treponema sp.]|nr:PD-(D/E)XK nuclease family protein [Treponema sp.]